MTLLATVFSSAITPSSVMAQVKLTQTQAKQLFASELSTTVEFTLPPPPVTDAPVGRSRGGGVRGGCGLNEITTDLAALVPAYDLKSSTDNDFIGNDSTNNPLLRPPTIQLVWSYTTQDYPTFWFYLPYELQGQTEVVFVLQEVWKPEVQSGGQPEARFNTLHVEALYPTTSPGLVSIKVPEAIAPLAVGQNYKWSFQIYCGEQADAPDFVEGWIYRTELDATLTTQLETATPQEQLHIYVSNGIWQDALEIALQLRQAGDAAQSGHQEWMEEWRSILQSVSLEDLADYPFANCCNGDGEEYAP